MPMVVKDVSMYIKRSGRIVPSIMMQIYALCGEQWQCEQEVACLMTPILVRRTRSVGGREKLSEFSGASRSCDIALKKAGRQSQGAFWVEPRRVEGSKLKSPPSKPGGHPKFEAEDSVDDIDFGVFSDCGSGNIEAELSSM